MRNLMLASAMVCLIVGPAIAASTVTMELEVGGSNNGASCDNRVCFTPGTTDDGQTVYVDVLNNNQITWAVRIHASGTHPGQSGDVPIRGVANFVFDLELYLNSVAPGNLVTTATFTSTTNSTGNCGNEADPSKNPTSAFLTNAAFAYAFNVNNGGPARVFDWLLADAQGHKAGGPRLDVHCYPKAAAGTGKMFGMGAGYSSFNKDPNLTQYTTGGVGMGDAPSCPTPSLPGCIGDSVFGCLGWGPVAEGQIENLVLGQTYVLRLIPGGGVNILRNEATTTKEVFALAADNASQVDTITFVPDIGAAPTITGWSTVRSHAGTNMSIPLNSAAVAGSYATETRIGGVQQIVVDFDQDVTARYSPGHVTVSNGLVLGTQQLINGGTSLQINVSGAVNRQCYLVDITGSVTGLAAGQDTTCGVQVLEGDVTGEGLTDLTDVAQVKIKNSGSPIIAGPNVKYDINCDGFIDLTDVAFCKIRNANVKTCN